MYREVMATVQAEAECLTFASFVEGSEEMHRLLPLFKAVSPFDGHRSTRTDLQQKHKYLTFAVHNQNCWAFRNW